MTANEVLHLYLGQKVQIDNSGSKVDNRVLVAVGGFGDEPYCKLRMEGTSFVHTILLKNGGFKLILRPLNSMTEDEAAQVADIVIGSFDSVKWKVDKKFKVVDEIVTSEFIYFDVHKKHRGYSKSLTIDERGEIDVYDEETIDQYFNQHSVTAYLLSNGFDIFGLREKNQCLYESDIKTTKT